MGPSTEPRGTPVDTVCGVDIKYFIITRCRLFDCYTHARRVVSVGFGLDGDDQMIKSNILFLVRAKLFGCFGNIASIYYVITF